MIATRDTIPPFATTDPSQLHHDERLVEYQTNLHEHIEQRIAAGEDPDSLEAELEARKIEGQRIKEEWMRRFYGAENVSAKRFLDFVSATTLPTR
jgi:hypothetical protein